MPHRTIGFSHSLSGKEAFHRVPPFLGDPNVVPVPNGPANNPAPAFVCLNSSSVRKNPCVARCNTHGETTAVFDTFPWPQFSAVRRDISVEPSAKTSQLRRS